MLFVYNGLTYEGRQDHVKGINAIIEKCENLGSTDPADVEELQTRIQRREARIKKLNEMIATLKKENKDLGENLDKSKETITNMKKKIAADK